MRKIINRIATIQYDKIIDSVVISFEKKGDATTYEETMELAEEMANLNETDNWLFIKKDFSDFNTDQFLLLINDWSLKYKCFSNTCKVAVLTKNQAFEKLKKKYSWLREKSKNMNLGVFNSISKAYSFLSPKDLLAPQAQPNALSF